MPETPGLLIVATRNSHKTAEFRALLGDDWEVADLSGSNASAPAETGSTFEENAAIKALAALQDAPPGALALADDSGLEVDALGGRPGVHSARFAGGDATDADNRARLLRELEGVPDDRRTARFRCALALARDGTVIATVHGSVEGRILTTERGSGGFGYDSLFQPDGWSETFAELAPEIKNRLSHRGRAIEALLPVLRREAAIASPRP